MLVEATCAVALESAREDGWEAQDRGGEGGGRRVADVGLRVVFAVVHGIGGPVHGVLYASDPNATDP